MEVCPHCGNDEYYQKGKASGFVIVNARINGVAEEVDNSEMYREVWFALNKTKRCNHCNRVLKIESGKGE